MVSPLRWPAACGARIFSIVLRARAALYRRGVLAVHRLDAPVISIGNLTTGGTGKTPLAIHTARLLSARGYRTVLLSRGYGRRSRRTPLVVPPDPACRVRAEEVGDEPALIRRKAPGVWLAISADRRAAAGAVPRAGVPTVFLLDDGFQHLRLHRDLDIVLIHEADRILSNRLLPAGSMREPLAGLERCDILMLNGTGEDSQWDAVREVAARINPRMAVFRCRQSIARIVRLEDWLADPCTAPAVTDLPPVYLVAAIANPHRFRADAPACRIDVRGQRFFRDHYPISAADWSSCIEAARSSGARAIVTTEKDAVKLSRAPAFPVLVAVLEIAVAEAAAFEEILGKACRRAM